MYENPMLNIFTFTAHSLQLFTITGTLLVIHEMMSEDDLPSSDRPLSDINMPIVSTVVSSSIIHPNSIFGKVIEDTSKPFAESIQ